MTAAELSKLAQEADGNDCPAAALELYQQAVAQGDTRRLIKLHMADCLRELGRFRESEILLKPIQLSHPNDWRGPYAMGMLFLDQKNFAEAAVQFRKVTQLEPGRTWPWLFLAKALKDQEQPRKALTVLKKGLATEGDLDEIHLNLGLVYRSLGEYVAARRSLENALEITPSYADARFVLQDIDFCLGCSARRTKDGRLDLSDDELRRLATETYEDDLLASAVELFNEMLARGTGGDGTRFRLAECLRILHRFAESEALFASITDVPPHKRGIFFLCWGQLHFDRGRFALAESLCRDAIKCDLDSTIPRVYLAEALAKQERFAEAIEELEHALKVQGDLGEVHLKLALLHRSLGDYKSARDFARKARALDATSEETTTLLRDLEQCLKWRAAKR